MTQIAQSKFAYGHSSFVASLGDTLIQQGYIVKHCEAENVEGWRVFALGQFVADVWLSPTGLKMSPLPNPDALFWWKHLYHSIRAAQRTYKSGQTHD
jgi:hypothetical protein